LPNPAGCPRGGGGGREPPYILDVDPATSKQGSFTKSAFVG
jgi:hypothetical protein